MDILYGAAYPATYRIDGPGRSDGALERVVWYNKNPLKRVPEMSIILDTQDPPRVLNNPKEGGSKHGNAATASVPATVTCHSS
jgi:hypothetical protein